MMHYNRLFCSSCISNDLVVKQNGALRAYEIKWSSRRVSGRAFLDAYGVAVVPIRPQNPFATEIFKDPP